MRRVEAGDGEDELRSLPVGERRRSVCSWGVAFAARKVERGLVRSIVCDIVRVGTSNGWTEIGEGVSG